MVVADRVVVELEARTGAYTRNLRNAETTATRTTRNITNSFRALGGALAALGVGLSVNAIVNLTGAWTDLNSRVRLATGGLNAGRETMARLADMADRTYSSLEQTAEAFLLNSTALSELGYNTTQQLDLTESLNNALVVSGARGDQARQVMEAWSRAMALGTLQGQNLNTVIQTGGRLATALATSMGVSTNELRKLGQEGKITTREMFGVTSQMEILREEADNMPATIEDGFLRIRNAVFRLIGEIDEATGSSAALADELIAVAEWFNSNREGIVGFFETVSKGFSDLRESMEWFRNNVGVDPWLEIGGDGGLIAIKQMREEFESVEDRIALARMEVMEFSSDLVTMGGVPPEIAAEIERIVDELILAETSAQDAETALRALDGGNFRIDALISQLAGVVARLGAVEVAAGRAAAAVANVAGGPVGDDGSGRGGLGQSRRASQAAAEATAAYIAEQERLAGLTRDQLTLENEMVRVRKEAADQGVRIAEEEVRRLAQLRVAANETRTGGGSSGRDPSERFQEALEAQRRQIEMLREETAVRAGLNPLVNDYGYALERLRIQQDLENEATRAGLALTPDRVAAISMLAEEYANASVEAARLTEQQQDLKDTVEEWAGIMKSATRGFIDDLLEGKDAAEAFGNVLRNIGNQLINMGLSSLFSPAGFGSLFGGFRANGGPVSSGRSYIVGERGPELFTPSSGGRITANHDLGGGGANVTFAPQIDARGADVAAVARLEEVIIRQQAEFDGRVKQIVRGANRNWRA